MMLRTISIVKQSLAGKPCLIRLDAQHRQLQALVEGQAVKSHAIRGLYNGEMSFPDYVEYIVDEVRSQEKRWSEKK